MTGYREYPIRYRTKYSVYIELHCRSWIFDEDKTNLPGLGSWGERWGPQFPTSEE